MAVPHCSGIIVIHEDKTILVSTEKGNYSFPKGKREKGEISIETAWRELNEETGLSKENVILLENVVINELSRKGNISVQYFVGNLIKNPLKLTFNPDELKNAEWIGINNAYKLDQLRDRRKEILKQAHAYTLIHRTNENAPH